MSNFIQDLLRNPPTLIRLDTELARHELRDPPPVMVVDKDISQRQTRPVHDREPMPIIGSAGAPALPSTAL